MTAALSAFIEDAYRDTLSLMTELRDYLAAFQTNRADVADAQMRTRAIAEISTMTRNLTEAMAWLLLRKAAMAGEITEDEAQVRSVGLMDDSARVARAEPASPPVAGVAPLPVEMRGYMDRSRRLYDQILRLRESTDRTARSGAGGA
ncbi:MAG: DUF1465 family protein [Rhodospirillaceae bacterium]